MFISDAGSIPGASTTSKLKEKEGECMYIVKLTGDRWLCRCFQGGWHVTYVKENAEKFTTREEATAAANSYCQGWSYYEVVKR